MKLTFKQLLYLLLTLGFLSFCMVTCSKQILPLFKSDPEPQAELVFQSTREEQIQDDISRLLTQLYGKKSFYVSVTIDLHYKNEESRQHNINPNTIADKYLEKHQGKTDAIRELLINNSLPPLDADIALPGLLDKEKISPKIDQSLPGFPLINPNKNSDPKDSLSIPERKATFTKEISDDTVYFNQSVTKTSTPNTSIDRVLVSVVLEKDRFDLLDIEREDLAKQIKVISGLDDLRGDRLLISVLPFTKKGFDVAGFLLKHKATIDKIKAFFGKLKWLFIGLIIIGILGGLGYLGYRASVHIMDKRRKEREERLRREREEEMARKEEEASAVDGQKSALTDLAKNKPKEFAQLLLNYIAEPEKKAG